VFSSSSAAPPSPCGAVFPEDGGGSHRNMSEYNFHSRTVDLDIIKVLSPTDAKENCFKRNFEIYIKTAPTLMFVDPSIIV
jgi:hypothetical protein